MNVYTFATTMQTCQSHFSQYHILLYFAVVRCMAKCNAWICKLCLCVQFTRVVAAVAATRNAPMHSVHRIHDADARNTEH